MKLKIVSVGGHEETIEVRSYKELKPMEMVPQDVYVKEWGTPSYGGHENPLYIPKQAFFAMLGVVARNNKITAIKMARDFVPSLGIVDAKDLIEEIFDKGL